MPTASAPPQASLREAGPRRERVGSGSPDSDSGCAGDKLCGPRVVPLLRGSQCPRGSVSLLRQFAWGFRDTQRKSPGKAMAAHSSVLAWRIPGTGEPGGLPSKGSHRVGHD